MLKKLSLSIAIIILCVSGTSAIADEGGAFVTFKVLKPEVALDLAKAALASCRKNGFQVAVTVVDRFGITQVTLRDRYAGAHTPETSRRKAWTSASFRGATLELAGATKAGSQLSGVRFVTNALMAGGGVPIDAGGTMVGAVGVSGAPTGDADEACAQAGIDAVEDQIAF